jgi:hypothetical protein
MFYNSTNNVPTASPHSMPNEGDDDTDTRSMTFGMLGILLFLDICFLSNYILCKALRQYTDTCNNFRRVEYDPINAVNIKEESFFSKAINKYVCGFCLGRIKPIPLSVQRFPDWQPIKYNIQILLTGFFILLSLVILNPAAFFPKGVDFLRGITLGSDVCKPYDRKAGLTELESKIHAMTNYPTAIKQWSHMNVFQEALWNDTTRYGVHDDMGDHSCPDIPASGVARRVPGLKSQWSDITQYPASEFGSFFPGYCSSAREAAKISALSVPCHEEKCACPQVPSTTSTRFFGIDGDELCHLRICIKSPIACPGHTKDDEYNPNNYKEAQLSALNNDTNSEKPANPLNDKYRDSAKRGAKLILFQVDVASNLYAIYSILSLFNPSPLVVFRVSYWNSIKRFLFGTEHWKFIVLFVSIIWIYKYLKETLLDPDFTIVLRNFLTGDPCYLDAKYVYDRHLMIDKICDELVPLQPSFEMKAQLIPSILQEINEFAKASCKRCKFPMEFLYNFRTEKYPIEAVGDLGFTKLSPSHLCARRSPSNCTVLFPDDNIEFLGNRTMCLDSDVSRALVLVAPETGLSIDALLNMWVYSGLLASFLVKIAMTNFLVALLYLADPFVKCGGEFLWIPKMLGSGLAGMDQNAVFQGFKRSKHDTLQNIYLRGVIIWGTIMHFCVINLWITAVATSKQLYGELLLGREDRVMLSISFALSVVIVAITYYWKYVLTKLTKGVKEEQLEASSNLTNVNYT